jgi:triosephosphate isomerase
MTDTLRPLIAGNWKMNGLRASLGEFEAMLAGASDVADKADLLVCPPATLIADGMAIAGPRRGNRDIASPDTRQASRC